MVTLQHCYLWLNLKSNYELFNDHAWLEVCKTAFVPKFDIWTSFQIENQSGNSWPRIKSGVCSNSLVIEAISWA